VTGIWKDDDRACGVCRELLDRHTIRGGEQVTYSHAGGAVLDHEPIPVRVDEVQLVVRCDFCHDLDPTWLQPARDYATVGSHRSSGGWLACDVCADLINRGVWSGLTNRCANTYVDRHPDDELVAVREAIGQVHRQLRRHLDGPIRRLPA
jgi:hypothetical protein